MSRISRCRQAGRRARQHYGRIARGRLIPARTLAALFLLLLAIAIPAHSQNLLRIQILEGEGLVNAAGSRSERPIAVQLTDETGRPLEGVAVSFRLPEEGPGGAFESGMKTDIAITTAEGRASIHGIRWNRTPGPFQIRITAAKGDSRAGAICAQYISDAPAKKGSRTGDVGSGGKRKWFVVAAIAAGGAAAAGMAVSRNAARPAAGGPAPGSQPVQIGPPTLSITRP